MLDLPLYWFIAQNQAMRPTFIYVAVAIALTPVLAQTRVISQLARSPFVLAMVAFALLNLANWSLAPTVDHGNVALNRLQLAILAIVVYGAFVGGFAEEKYRKVLMVTLAICIGSVWFDYLLPNKIVGLGIEGPTPGRASAFYINANRAGEAIVLCGLMLAALVPRAWAVPISIVCLVGTIPTLSRGAWICGIVFVLIALMRSGRPKIAIAVLIAAGLAYAIGLSQVITWLLWVTPADTDLLAFSSRVDWLAGDSSISEFSTDERFAGAMNAFETFIGSPIIGGGAGYTGLLFHVVGPHNQTLLMIGEYGILGLMLWGALVYGLFFKTKSPYRVTTLTFGVVFLCFSVFTHNMLDNVYSLVALAFFSFLGESVHEPRTQHLTNTYDGNAPRRVLAR